MAQLAATFVVLFFFFAFSGANLQEFSTENEDTDKDLSKSTLDTDSNPVILFPSEKPESADESASAEIDAEHVDVDDLLHVTLTEPETFVSFRPINRHFRVNRQYPLRYTRRRPCRHFVKPINPRSGEMSYGNDMILSSKNNNHQLDPEVLFRDQVIPSMELRFQRENHNHQVHHHHHRSGLHNEFMPKYVFAREKLKRPFRREEEEREKKEKEERENRGFVKRFRKFLNDF